MRRSSTQAPPASFTTMQPRGPCAVALAWLPRLTAGFRGPCTLRSAAPSSSQPRRQHHCHCCRNQVLQNPMYCFPSLSLASAGSPGPDPSRPIAVVPAPTLLPLLSLLLPIATLLRLLLHHWRKNPRRRLALAALARRLCARTVVEPLPQAQEKPTCASPHNVVQVWCGVMRRRLSLTRSNEACDSMMSKSSNLCSLLH